MIPPGLLVIFSPLVTGILFGVEAVCGLLIGAVISAVQLAISQSNSGGAERHRNSICCESGATVSDSRLTSLTVSYYCVGLSLVTTEQHLWMAHLSVWLTTSSSFRLVNCAASLEAYFRLTDCLTAY